MFFKKHDFEKKNIFKKHDFGKICRQKKSRFATIYPVKSAIFEFYVHIQKTQAKSSQRLPPFNHVQLQPTISR